MHHSVDLGERDGPHGRADRSGIRDDLVRAARERGQSLQVFLREVLEVEARKSRNREILRTMTPILGTHTDVQVVAVG